MLLTSTYNWTSILTDLENQFYDKFHPERVAAGAYKDENDVILFHHIPKAAGTSVGASLQDIVDVFHGVPWDNVQKGFVKASNRAIYDRTGKNMRQLIMGHYNASNVNFWRNNRLPIKAACIVRDPVARFVSQYNYNCSEKHPAHMAFRNNNPDLLTFARSLNVDFQLRYLLGPFYDFDDALGRLIQDFSFLGCVEHLNASLTHFSKSHGFPEMTEFSLNTGSRPTSEVEVSDEVRDLVISKSRNDLKFHQLVQSLYS